MPRAALVVVLAIAVVVSSPPAFAQGGFLPMGPIGDFDIGPVNLSAAVQVGYQNVGWNFNLPTRPLFGLSSSLDLQLQDAYMWVGSAGVGARIGPDVSVFFLAEGNIPKTVTVLTPDTGLSESAFFAPYRWKGSRLQWWAVDLGVAYRIVDQVSILGGLRRDQFALGLSDPVDQFGNPVNFSDSFQVDDWVFTEGEVATGDILAKLWVPYVGLGLNGRNYRFSVIWSPFVSTSVKIPQRLLAFLGLTYQGFPIYDANVSFDFRYSVKKPAALLEGNLEYDIEPYGMFGLKLWAKGSWLSLKSSGRVEFDAAEAWNGFIIDSLSDSASETATFRRHIIATGLTAVVAF